MDACSNVRSGGVKEVLQNDLNYVDIWLVDFSDFSFKTDPPIP